METITKESFLGALKIAGLTSKFYNGGYQEKILTIDYVVSNLSDVGYSLIEAGDDNWIEARYYSKKLNKTIVLSHEAGFSRNLFGDIDDSIIDDIIEETNYYIAEARLIEKRIK